MHFLVSIVHGWESSRKTLISGFFQRFPGFSEWVFPIQIFKKRENYQCNNMSMTPKALKLHLWLVHKTSKTLYSSQKILSYKCAVMSWCRDSQNFRFFCFDHSHLWLLRIDAPFRSLVFRCPESSWRSCDHDHTLGREDEGIFESSHACY
jgi:hypothetical protein